MVSNASKVMDLEDNVATASDDTRSQMDGFTGGGNKLTWEVRMRLK